MTYREMASDTEKPPCPYAGDRLDALREYVQLNRKLVVEDIIKGLVPFVVVLPLFTMLPVFMVVATTFPSAWAFTTTGVLWFLASAGASVVLVHILQKLVRHESKVDLLRLQLFSMRHQLRRLKELAECTPCHSCSRALRSKPYRKALEGKPVFFLWKSEEKEIHDPS